MLTGEIRNQVDRVWDTFWTGGISNPLEVIEQLTYLLFIKRLDELHTARENKANRLGQPIEDPIFGPDQQNLRWSPLQELRRRQPCTTSSPTRSSPSCKTLGGDETAFATHMKDARFTLPPEKAGLLASVVDMIDQIPMDDRDTKGDLYEYMLSKLSTAGQNGQFRTPRHIIKMMVAMVAPTPTRHHLRPGLRHGRFPGRRRRISARAPPRNLHRPGPAPPLRAARCSTASTSTAPCCASPP